MDDKIKINTLKSLPEQNTQEWLEWRKGMIGASDAPIIMFESPWKTPYKLWCEKVGLEQPPPPNQFMQRGHELEPIAREKFEELTGHIVTPVTMVSKDHPWMMASLDGLSFCGKVMVEIKCPGQSSHDIAKRGFIPESYRAQLQHQLVVNPGAVLYYFSFRDNDCAIVEVIPDQEYQKRLVQEEYTFWKQVQELTPPELLNMDFQVKEDANWQAACYDYRLAKESLEVAVEKEKKARERLIELADGQSSKGCNIRVAKYIRKGSVDYSAIPELKKVDLSSYRKAPAECWRVTYDNSFA